jgi:hypothetical protein
MHFILRILKYGILRVPPIQISTKKTDAQFRSVAVRRKKNKNDKKSVSFKWFAICGNFTRALLAHPIFKNPVCDLSTYLRTNLLEIIYWEIQFIFESVSLNILRLLIFARTKKYLLEKLNFLKKTKNLMGFDLAFLILIRPNDGTFTSFSLHSNFFFA